MSSQKNDDPKHCIKCNALLALDNWNSYDKKVSHYICNVCRKNQDKARHTSAYNKKQLSRYRGRRSAVIHFYGDNCIQCGEDEFSKLIINGNNTPNIYDLLYNNKILDGYQVLCYNCYHSKICYKNKYSLRDKQKVIEHYGNKCSICEENRIERLIVKRPRMQCGSGIKFYRWIIKNKYPDITDLKILCYNCSKINT